MLHIVRKYAYSWTTRIVLMGLALLLTFWGVTLSSFNRIHPVATVDGTQILPEEINRRASEIRSNIQRLAGAEAPEVLKNINLRHQALDSLIDNQLITNRARQLGIVITDNALQQKISSLKGFQRDGQFDFDSYEENLRQQGMTPHEFEDEMRSDMLSSALRSMIYAGIQVSPDDARHAYDLTNQRVGFSYVDIPWTNYAAGISPTDAQLKEFYDKNSADFREPDKAQFVFIHYDPLKLAAKLEPPEADVQDYYKRAIATRFTHPEQVHARHILISVPAGATTKEKDAARAKTSDIAARAQKGEDFVTLARQYSQDPGSKSSGGDLGFFGRGQMIKPFEDAVFLMTPGSITMVESSYGFHVIKLEEKRPARTDTIDEARPKIVEAIRSDAGAKLARKAVEEDMSAVLGGSSLDDLAHKRGLDAVSTPMVSIADGIKDEPNSRDLIETAMRLEPGAARTVPAGDAPYLVKAAAHESAHIPALKTVEPKVRQAYIRVGAVVSASATAAKLLEQIKTAAAFDSVVHANHLEVKTIEPFERSRADVPGLGNIPDLGRDAGFATAVPSIISRVLDRGGDSLIFELTSRAAPSNADWTAAQDTFVKEFLERRRTQAWTRYLDELKNHAQIKIDAEQLGASEPSM